MSLCSQFALNIGFEKVNIVIVDTDVTILGIYFQSMLNSKIYLQYGTSSAAKLYDLPENSRSLVQALPGLYAFSGYNKTSCFEEEGTLGFVHYVKFCLTKTILTEKIKCPKPN